ncbi:DUF2868 domain-containing protein [Azotobacter beijerinckii]|uniref:DUF2868 domain-containing protein n=1 Tax=Azotobacter beijerinckii TaxID=170623 RepID=A0A1I4B685_9GAMM|nr:DUF2868 domain-containing protein [Azotobacter beijerinckii]SFA89395.1 Protein of unknown function [Azotobacter beijerinckii]SFK64053.1 Protein of unknown function [Azotobacter beijerinckii]
MSTAAPPPTDFNRLWLTETIRLREEFAGPLEDGEANRRARAAGGNLTRRIQTRALWLAERDGLLDALRHWRQGGGLALAILLALAVGGGASLALAALGAEQKGPINVFWALGSLLGLHLLTLCGWLLGLFFAADGGGGALGRLWLWLSEKLARDAKVALLAPALLLLLQHRRLGRWGLGLLVHGFWLLTLTSALVTLLALMSTRSYGFYWETTLLDGDTFVALTQNLGALPAMLGFSLPDPATIRASADQALSVEAARQGWAGWLLGVLLVYGLLPRLLLALLCLNRWLSGRAHLAPDLSLPGYRLLAERLQPSSERLGVCDAAPETLPQVPRSALGRPAESTPALLVAVELDENRPWPPVLPGGVGDAGVLDSREQRRRLLERLAGQPPARLAVAVDPQRSPDRGTLALLGELSRSAGRTRVWLLPPPPGETLNDERLDDWHIALNQLGLHYGSDAPLGWLETGDD